MNYLVEQTDEFRDWHARLRDLRARIAIARRIERAIVLLCGGDKHRQKADIKRAQQMATDL
ncbi:MAG TPA: hypothetical protein VFG67_11000 [Oleiagrimonas sp.]|jgi:putative component of toxin-antitoxin plasmid stabilization module|nr:hypothetical protein [Oleiagrimonas sp.]